MSVEQPENNTQVPSLYTIWTLGRWTSLLKTGSLKVDVCIPHARGYNSSSQLAPLIPLDFPLRCLRTGKQRKIRQGKEKDIDRSVRTSSKSITQSVVAKQTHPFDQRAESFDTNLPTSRGQNIFRHVFYASSLYQEISYLKASPE